MMSSMMGRFQSVMVVVLLSMLSISSIVQSQEETVQHAAIRGAIRRTAAREQRTLQKQSVRDPKSSSSDSESEEESKSKSKSKSKSAAGGTDSCEGDYTYCASSGECIQAWVTFCSPGGGPAPAASSSSSEEEEPEPSSSSEEEEPEPEPSSSSSEEEPEPVVSASSSSSEDVPVPAPIPAANVPVMDLPTYHPTVTDQPSDTFKPTYHPTTTDQPTRTDSPTTFLPTITPFPTYHPTITDQPTNPPPPTFNPTVTSQPTRTQAPTFHPTVTDQPTTPMRPENCKLCDTEGGFTNKSYRAAEWEYASCEEASAYVYVSIEDYGFPGQCNYAKKAAFDAGCICEGYVPPSGFKPADTTEMGDIP